VIDLSPIETALVNWLAPAFVPSASQVVFANQNLEQPAFPYASILLIGSARIGGRDDRVDTTVLTRAKNPRITPTAADNATYTVTIGTTGYSYTSGSGATAASITAGLAAALASSGLTITDNHGTLDLLGSSVFLLVVTDNLTWENLDAGHEMVETTKAHRRLTLQITFHLDENTMVAGAAYPMALSAEASLSQQRVIDQLLADGLAVVKTEGVRDMSHVVGGSQWVNRAQLDVVFNTLFELTDDSGYIAEVSGTGSIGSAEFDFDIG
jgi:hypothetical protein